MPLDFPSNPTNGQVYDSYVYNSTVGAWQSREDSRTVAILSSTVPASANPGDIWVNTNDGISFVYYDDGTSAQWMELLPSGVPLLNTKANLVGDNSFSGGINYFGTGGLNGTFISSNTGRAQFTVNSASGTPLMVRGIASQTGDLQQWQDSTSAVISKVDSAGSITAPRFISTQATGTAPMTVSSTTAVTNLNADLLDGNHSTAFSPVAGSSSIVTVGNVTSGKWQASPVDVIYGGTGTNTLTSGSYLKGNGTNGIISQTGIPAGDITSGALGVAYGGTGATTGAGGIPMVATSTAVNAGTASTSASGVVTFSGVTNLSLNGIFNANYEHYRVVVTNFASSSAGANQSVQLRASGTTLTAATYQWYGYRFVSWSNAAIAGNGAGSWYMMESNTQSNAYYTSVMDFISPFNSAEYTRYINSSYIYAGSYGMAISNGMIGTAASYDGLTFNFTAASSGSVRVYGYK